MLVLKVPFGLRADELVEPAGVPNGKACGCICPGCGQPLVAYNQGKIRTTQYFGHLPGSECARGHESAVHLAGKQAVLQAKWMSLPALEVDTDGIAPREHKPLRTHVVERAMAAVYQSVDAEVPMEVVVPQQPPAPQVDLFAAAIQPEPTSQTLRPDLRAQRGSDIDWIEVRVTHAVDERKRKLMQSAGLRVVEIDLSGLLRPGITLDDVRQAVLDNPENKVWLAHPEVPRAAAALREALRRESELSTLEQFRRAQQETNQPRRWLSDGEELPAIALPPPAAPPTDAERLQQLRHKLELSPSAPWPRYLDLDLVGNGGSKVHPRVWLSSLYLDWVRDRAGARYLISDLQSSVAAKFGVMPRWGHRDLRRALEKRVLPYWAACGLVVVNGELVVVAETSKQQSRS